MNKVFLSLSGAIVDVEKLYIIEPVITVDTLHSELIVNIGFGVPNYVTPIPSPQVASDFTPSVLQSLKIAFINMLLTSLNEKYEAIAVGPQNQQVEQFESVSVGDILTQSLGVVFP